MKFDDKLIDLKGIGPKRAEALGRLGLFTLRDLLYFAPREHYDLRKAKTVAELTHGEYALIKIDEIDRPKISYPTVNGKRTPLLTVTAGDSTGRIRLSWFNQPFMRTQIPEEPMGFVHGRVDLSRGRVMVNALFCANPPGIMPVYPLTRGIGQGSMRTCVKSVLYALEGNYGETLPDDLRMEHGLCQLGFALENIHFPINPEALSIAKRRFSFENTLYFTILLEALRSRTLHSSGIPFRTSGCIESFLKRIPFSPTKGQLDIMGTISDDMSSPVPMNRLVQGDVGSGKTLLAFYAMYVAVSNGYQAALMAPTGILAEQHYSKLKKLFGESAQLLTSGMTSAEKSIALSRIRSGDAKYIIGTHSLIEGKVEFKKVGVVIADEQHRFGVRQRADLGNKALAPDVLIMSATPIPRTLSLILYGDLDVSKLVEMPNGRKPVATRYVPPAKRDDMYRYIEREIGEKGVQAFVVCPMIEDNDEVRLAYSAEAVYAELAKRLSIRLGLLHGRMKPDKRDEVMRSFRDGEIDLLVSTTVIEVGVDIPNACIMVVEAADRFGLAQLHQLRGRVGRSDKESYCFLLSESRTESVAERIRTLVNSQSGFEIAEKDLITRGPGELLGQRQHGNSSLIDALALSDIETLTEAREAAIKLLNGNSAEEKALVRNVIEKHSAELHDIAIN